MRARMDLCANEHIKKTGTINWFPQLGNQTSFELKKSQIQFISLLNENTLR